MYDYLIIGQGLAGTILGYTFLRNGKKVFIIDKNELSSCSRVAAGNYNPIVFKRLVKSWKAEEAISYADNFFKEAEQFLNSEFFWKKEILKVFADEREKKFWIKRAADEDKYLEKKIVGLPGFVKGNFGGGKVKDAGKIHAAKFLDEFRNYFLNLNLIGEEKFDYNRLAISDNTGKVEYVTDNSKIIWADKIIFCEGWIARDNPYFSYLPFKPAKGEILLVRIEDYSYEKIIHKNGYLYQIGENLFVAGTTYEWDELNDLPTEKGKNIIIEKLEKIIHIPYEIIGHFAGVRPSSKDRGPFIGLHPKYKSVGIFNGFGTKAVMLAPFFADQFYNFLEFDLTLDAEVNINRFKN